MKQIFALTIALSVCIPLFHGTPSRASDLPPERHPGILYDSSSVNLIRDRVGREPYSAWWQGIRSMAIQGLTMNFTGATENTKARYSKYLAFAYVVADSLPYGQKCLEVLQLINPSGNWGAELHNHAEPMMSYSEAYDMLKGSGFNLGSSEAQIRANLAAKAQEFRNNLLILLYANNWRVRYLSALGIAAMTLADHASAESWHDWAESMVMPAFISSQVVGEGAWAEGPDYLLYSADIYLPYMLAFHRLITGADLINEPAVHLTHDWSWKIRLPNGQRPNFEDAHLTYFYGDLLATVYDDAAIHQWDYVTIPDTADLFASDHWRIDAICYFDDAIAPQAPELPATFFLPEAGHAVFRSGWGPDDVYLFLIGEHGPARINGLGHDHADAASFVLYAYGEMLALDAGYISWNLRTAVNKARNHSMILVDGSGPPSSTQFSAGDADAFIKNFYNIGSLQFCDDSTYYQNVSIVRSVLFADSERFIIRDRAISPAWHAYDWRLHGNGGGTSGGSFNLQSDGAVWSRAGASLHALVSTDVVTADAANPLIFTATTDTHSFAYNQILTHSTLNARLWGQSADFLSMLSPIPAGTPPPLQEKIPVSHGVAIGTTTDLAWSSDPGGDHLLTEEIEGFGSIKTEVDWFYLGLENGVAALLHLISCGSFALRDTILFSSDHFITFALDRRGDLWDGYVKGGGSYRLWIYSGDNEPQQVRFNGSPAPFVFIAGQIQVDLAGEGYLQVEFDPNPLWMGENGASFPGYSPSQTSDPYPLHLAASSIGDGLNIFFNLAQPAPVSLMIYDVLGRVVAQHPRVHLPPGEYRQRFDSSTWPSGIYLIHVNAGNTGAVQKVALIR
jgi:hypothetical protein